MLRPKSSLALTARAQSGPDHDDTERARNNLAGVLVNMGKPELMGQVLDVDEAKDIDAFETALHMPEDSFDYVRPWREPQPRHRAAAALLCSEACPPPPRRLAFFRLRASRQALDDAASLACPPCRPQIPGVDDEEAKEAARKILGNLRDAGVDLEKPEKEEAQSGIDWEAAAAEAVKAKEKPTGDAAP